MSVVQGVVESFQAIDCHCRALTMKLTATEKILTKHYVYDGNTVVIIMSRATALLDALSPVMTSDTAPFELHT